ncbi:peptide-methionine (S)-S-oxide reductase [Actimicrobium sp. GrIS 1.19]|uniref:peptide-methionine (S)-S-oxide reductase MsrA n=1 Tax=Actimicrobium sp. GrIS 1.19 TaxID=3071708 RepID=UPI002E07E7A3|nr:peptide-methionine (S)-S-oxide reductase [Actimicrobium sp. GrIS 1.19]
MKRFSLFLTTLLLAAAAHAQSPAPAPATAVFGGGCFWCMEADFEKLPGVITAESGYAGGKLVNPSYEQVSAGNSGHIEVVKVTYDPAKLTYAALLDYFWHHIDPTVQNRQFCDSGNQYRSAVFVETDAQRAALEASKAAILKAGVVKQIYTDTIPLTRFYPAEDYHQDYYKKNPIRYAYYRSGCGRDARVAEVWGTGKL